MRITYKVVQGLKLAVVAAVMLMYRLEGQTSKSDRDSRTVKAEKAAQLRKLAEELDPSIFSPDRSISMIDSNGHFINISEAVKRIEAQLKRIEMLLSGPQTGVSIAPSRDSINPVKK